MTSAAPEAPVVDAHVHIFTRDMPLAAHAWARPDYSFTAENLIATLDAHGVHFAVVAGISIYGYYNDYMIACLRREPRLRGTVNIPPTIERAELSAMKDAGVVGMRLFLSAQLTGEIADIRGEDYQRLFRRVRDLDWHVHFLADEAVFADALSVLQACGVKVVVDHFGGPTPRAKPDNPRVAATLRAMETGPVWMKISSGFRFAPRRDGRADYDEARRAETAFAAHLLARAGPERLLWGSDAPFVAHEGEVSYADTLDAFHQAVPDAQARRAISDAALKLYFS